MSILISTNSGKRILWPKQIEQISKHIVKTAEEKELHGADYICLKYDCPSKVYKNGKISTYRCKVNLYFKDGIYDYEKIYETLIISFKSAIDDTQFYIEDIPTNTITIEIVKYI